MDEKPLSAWSGSLKNPGDPDFPLELEVHAGGHGILRTEFGWYSHWVVVETKDGDIDAFDPDDSDRREEIDSLLQSHLPKSP